MSLQTHSKKKLSLFKRFKSSRKFNSRDSDRKVELERLPRACETKQQEVETKKDDHEGDNDSCKSISPTLGGSIELRRFQMTENYKRRRNALSIKDHFEFQRLRTKRVQQQIIDTYVYGWKWTAAKGGAASASVTAKTQENEGGKDEICQPNESNWTSQQKATSENSLKEQ